MLHNLGIKKQRMKRRSIEKKEEIHFNFLEIATAVPLSFNASVSEAVDTHKTEIFSIDW